MRYSLLLVVLFTQQVFSSALFEQTNANFWLFETNGAVSGFNHDGGWLETFDNSVYPLEAEEQVLINELPSSSVPMNTQLSPVSLNGLGDAGRTSGDTGGDPLFIEPAAGEYPKTIEVVMYADVDLIETHGSLTLLWQLNGGAFNSRTLTGANESIDGFVETRLFLVEDTTLHVELLDSSNVELVTLNHSYTINSDDPEGAQRDTDLDGLPDLVELAVGLDPLKDDWRTDRNNDGWSDFDQWLRSATSDATELPVDTDLDGWSDVDETWRGTDPNDTVQLLTTADPAHPAPDPDTQQYRDTLLAFKQHPVASRLYEVEYQVAASKEFGLDAYTWNASATSHTLLGEDRFDSATLLSDADLAWADVGPSGIADSLKLSIFETKLQNDQVAEFRVAASIAQTLDIIADETVILNPGTTEEEEALRRWHYSSLLAANPDLTPNRYSPVDTWTTAEEWKQLYISYLEQNLVVDQTPLLNLDRSLYVEALQLLLAQEIALQGGSGLIFWSDMDATHQQVIRQLQDDLSVRENARNLSQVHTDLQSMLDTNGLTQSYSWLQTLQSSVTEAVDVSQWLQQQAIESTAAEMEQFRYLSRMALFSDGLSKLIAQPDLETAASDTDADALQNQAEVDRPFSASTYPWAADSDGDLIIDSADNCPTGEDIYCSQPPLLQISASVNIDEPLSGQTQDLLISFQLDQAFNQDVSFTYTVTASGTDSATPDADFTEITGTATILAGQQVVHLVVPILADGDFSEVDESFHVEISDVTNALVADSSLVFLIAPAIQPPDSNAGLSDLSLSDGTLTPVFLATTLNYTATVANTVDSITITPTTSDANATVTVNGVSVTSGSASGAISLSVGINAISVVVTAADGSTTNTYSIDVTREAAASSNANLSDLSLSAASLNQVFQPSLLDYTASVAFTVSSTTVTPITSDTNATVTVNGVLVNSGSPSASISLNEGANTIDVVVTAEDTTTTQTYIITITRQSASTFAQQAYIKASNTGSGDFFGQRVTLDGDTLAVGAYEEDSSATGINGDQSDNTLARSGAVYVFTRSAGVWSQQAYIKASNTGASDVFGSSLALDGDTLVVGAYSESSNATGIDGNQTDDSASGAGAVYVYTRSSGVWSQQAYIKASNTEALDTFGTSLALSGDTLAVGATGEDSGASGIDGNQSDDLASSAGAVYVFTRTSGIWSQQAYVKASNTDPNDLFGYSVALHGDTLAVGAIQEDSLVTGIDGNQANDSAANAGAVYVFTRIGGIWSQQAFVKASNTDSGDRFGSSVALNGDTLAVGAIGEASSATGIDGDQLDDTAAIAGAVYVFTRTAGTWSQQAYIKASNAEAGDQFGSSIGLDIDTLVVGAFMEQSSATGVDGDQMDNSVLGAGAVYLFTRNAGVWNQQAYIKASNTGVDDVFGGYSVAIDGNTLATGAIFEDSSATGIDGDQSDESAPNSGAVYVFQPVVSLSSNADLAVLNLSDGSLTPSFTPSTYSYTTLVANAVVSITVTPTTADLNATVTVNGVAVTSGSASGAISLSVGVNTISVVVTAEDGTTTNTYAISVTREAPLNSDATLAALTLSNGTLTPTFDAGTNNYTAAVVNAVSSITVTPTTADTNASVRVNGIVVASDSASSPISLNVGANTISVVVTAEDGSTTNAYSISVTREAPVSTDATLSALSISDGTLTPAFDVGTVNYTTTVVYAITSVSVTPSTSDANASVTVNGVSVASGTASDPISLIEGANAISVVVTAEDGATTSSYSISVTREAASNDATLSGLSVSVGTLTPAFDSGGLSYDVTVSNATTSITITPTTSNVYATVTVDGDSAVSGTASSAISLNVGSNPIQVQVTAENSAINIYTVNVIREAPTSSDASLSGLTISAGSLDQIFQSSLLSYTATVSFTVSSSTVTPTTSDANATVTVNGTPVISGNASGSILLTVGDNTIPVVVTAEDGTTIQTYSIVITREADVSTTSDWQWANPLPQGNSISDIAWSGSQFVAVGNYGAVLTSPDGLTWTIRDAGTDANLYGIVWNGSQFFAVGTQGTIISSSDAVVWSVQTIGASYTFYSIVWNGSQFVAVGQREAGDFGGFSATSSDGEIWTVQDHTQAGGWAWNDVAWNGSQFAAVQHPSFIHTSTDGLAWTTTDLSADNPNFGSIESDGSRFVAVGFGVVYTSDDDGATWPQQISGSRIRGSDLIWDGSQFMAVDGFSSIFTSLDGATWQEQSLYDIVPQGTGINAVCTNGSQYIVAGSSGVIINSPDAADWTLQTSGEFVGLQDITWGNNLFVAVGNDKTVRTSPDGMAWTTRSSTVNDWSLNGVAWGDGQFVAVGGGDSNQVLASPDGVNWTARTPVNGPLHLENVAWGNGQFVAVGDSGTIMSSPDGITWTTQTSGVTASDTFRDVSWNGSLFVAVGYQNTEPYGGVVTTSADGVTWTNQELPWEQTVDSLTWDNNQFVAVGYQAILTSPDGLTWTLRSNNTNNLTNVGWTGSQYVAVGQNTSIFTSPDGMTWSSQRSIHGYYSGVASNGNRVVFVAPFGQIIANDAL